MSQDRGRNGWERDIGEGGAQNEMVDGRWSLWE